jgi:DNA invertase Pin-like site-specific DNA recombinase
MMGDRRLHQMRAAIYVRVSSDVQTVDNQLLELRSYVNARQWTIAGEFRDEGISGSKDRRPAPDRLMAEARRGKVDVICVWSLDRFGRSLAHVVTAVQDWHERGVAFVSLKEGLDLSTAAGRRQLHILGEFDRARLIEHTWAGLARARKQGKTLGRPARVLSTEDVERTATLSARDAAKTLRTSSARIIHSRRALLKTYPASGDFRLSIPSEIVDVEPQAIGL